MSPEIPRAFDLEKEVFAVSNEKQFDLIALKVFEFQFYNNNVYNQYCKLLNKTPDLVSSVKHIPFLPISFFKSHKIVTTVFNPELIFESSGTTGFNASRHYIKKASLYEASFTKAFNQFFGNIKNCCVLGLLPSYLERSNSSLVYMVDHLIRESSHPESGFYLYDYSKLNNVLQKLESTGVETVLFGVTYALLDFSNQYPNKLKNIKILETGGMKGRQKEMVKSELYDRLRSSFGLEHIYAEYGMTELLSQAYAIDGIYSCPPWMKVILRDETDPLSTSEYVNINSGAINIIDLANIYSCSFIATDDIGKIRPEGSLEVLGRLDNSDIRGCSLMVM
jgi:Acyl-protein synthetase, LuxE.